MRTDHFKDPATSTMPNPPPEGFRLCRIDMVQRTVRYEWPSLIYPGTWYHSPVFQATAQEWERAHG